MKTISNFLIGLIIYNLALLPGYSQKNKQIEVRLSDARDEVGGGGNYGLALHICDSIINLKSGTVSKEFLAEAYEMGVHSLFWGSKEYKKAFQYLEKANEYGWFIKNQFEDGTYYQTYGLKDYEFIQGAFPEEFNRLNKSILGYSNEKEEIQFDKLRQYIREYRYRITPKNYNDQIIIIKNKIIYYHKKNGQYQLPTPRRLSNIFNISEWSLGENVTIVLRNCEIYMHLMITDSNILTNKNVSNIKNLFIEDCKIYGQTLISSENVKLPNHPKFSGTTFQHVLLIYELDPQSKPLFTNSYPLFNNCTFYDRVFISSVCNNRGMDIINSHFYNHCNIKDKTLTRLRFKNNQCDSALIFTGNVDYFELSKSNINTLIFDDTNINNKLVLDSCMINQHIAFRNTNLPQLPKSMIPWSTIEESKIGILKNDKVEELGFDNINIYKAASSEDFKDTKNYLELLSVYNDLNLLYKARGDIYAANGCFVEMKDIQTKYLKYQYRNTKSFKNYFRWKLQALLKLYTEHGTDPAKAIVMSIYILFGFAVFYFFFPSDWDLTSKSKLVKDFKDFYYKKDKGFIKALLALLGGFIVSLFNALALSLNAFVTLGFGSIPTRGVAKYVCIIQGFIGWFLLSIFTVALINQVLF